MRKDALYIIIIIVLGGAVVVLTCSGPDPIDNDGRIYLDSIETLQASKRILSASIDSLVETSNYKAKVSDSILRAQEREISRLKIKASKARTPRVDTLILDNPELKVFVETQDSVILVQAVLIDTLKSQLAFERNVREQLVALHYDQAKIESQMSELKDQRIISLEKDLKKERRRGRFLKVVAIVGSVAAFIGGSQL